MRIVTWNLERGGRSAAARPAQDAVLGELAADVVVLTEPGPSFEAGAGTVASPRRRANHRGHESWIAIVGDCVEPTPFDVPFARMAVGAVAHVNGRRLLLYASVLPWNTFRQHAPELVRDGETSLASFVRVLDEQVADIEALRKLHPEHHLIWAGDFNQHTSGPQAGGSKAKREALVGALDALGLVAWNGDAAHASSGLHAIDLICGPRELDVVRQGRIDPVRDGVKMSDHAGYWVDLQPSAIPNPKLVRE